MKKVAAILSAGGASFLSACKIAKNEIEPFVITDRECGAEKACTQAGIEFKRIPFTTKEEFSNLALAELESREIKLSILLFGRLVGPQLFENTRCLNIHPSLLPSFKGLGAIKKTFASGVKFLGATLHEVDDTVDGGKIIAQSITPIPSSADIAWLNRASYLQKTLLCLVAVEQTVKDDVTGRLNPDLASDKLRSGFIDLQNSIKMNVYP